MKKSAQAKLAPQRFASIWDAIEDTPEPAESMKLRSRLMLAVQILGGAGCMRGSRAERIYREVKVMMIGGGTEEIMQDLAAKQLPC